jgi:hypothetical protein
MRASGGELMTLYRVAVTLAGTAVVEIEADSPAAAQQKAARYTVNRVLVERVPACEEEQVSVLEVRDLSKRSDERALDQMFVPSLIARGMRTGHELVWLGGSAEPCDECAYCGWLKRYAQFAEAEQRERIGETDRRVPASDALTAMAEAMTLTPEAREQIDADFGAAQQESRRSRKRPAKHDA